MTTSIARTQWRYINKTTRNVVSTFGALAGVSGIIHGIGEVLQGNVPLPSTVFQTWPGSRFFEVLNGEPAMSLIPNLLLSGILSIGVGLTILVWSIWFVERKHGRLVLILLSMVLLLVGGGFGPPLLGILIGGVGTKIHSPLNWWRNQISLGSRRLLGQLWSWLFTAALMVWLLLLAGLSILDQFFAVDGLKVIPMVFATAMGFLALSVMAAFARDSLSPDIQPDRWPGVRT